jgi:site-specific recombinase XerD
MKPTDFAYHLSTFLTSYMIGQRNLSKNTLKSYRDTFILLLEYFKFERAVPPEKLLIRLVDKTAVEEFLASLETVRGNSISTRNQRLAAIHAFFRYLQGEMPEYLFHCQKILSVPFKKTPQTVIPYLSEESMQIVLGRPDTSTLKGRRDLTLLCTLYDTGARVQELCDLTIRNVRLDIIPSHISLTGKGSKTRHIRHM